MEYHGKLRALLPARRTYFGQYYLLCLVKLAVLLLGLNALLRLLVALLFTFPPLLWVLFNGAATVLAIFYFLLNRPEELQFARWLDKKIGSKERFQTLFELDQPAGRGKENSAGTKYRVQTSPEMRAWIIEEADRYLQAHPPVVKPERRLLKRWLPGLLTALVIFAGVFYTSPLLSKWVSVKQEHKLAQREASQVLTELEELLAEEPLLEELLAELALVKEQLVASKNSEEVALSLQEARELLAEYAEKLEETGQAYQLPEELLAANSAAEAAAALEEDPRFNQQLLDSLQGLQNKLFQLSSAGAFELKEEISKIEEALGDKKDITPSHIQDLQKLLERLDPASAGTALRSGQNRLAAGTGSGKGGPQGSAAGPEEGKDKNGGGQPGEGTVPGEGDPGGNSGNNSQSGQKGAGTPGNGAGQEGAGTGGNSGENSNGKASGNGGEGAGAGTGSGPLAEEEFFFIPGDREVSLNGDGGEGSYTWQEILKYHPELVPEDLAPYYDRYYHQGLTSINRGRVPQPLENYLRAYFQAITPP
ncbi:MAG: hypothetical protein GX973_00670 [Firmicutes bacterium]|nr:hypothetical protein [Bacillota bacterium]